MTGTQLMITILGSVAIVSVFGFLTAITLAASKRPGEALRRRLHAQIISGEISVSQARAKLGLEPFGTSVPAPRGGTR